MSETVQLVLPVRADLVVLARYTAATIASRADFDVEEIDDLRLAVEELCLSVVDGSRDGRLELRFLGDEGEIQVECMFVADGGDAGTNGSAVERRNNLSDRIVDALVDEHGQDLDGGHPRAWLKKRRAPRPR